jgi:hypothetical protein
MRMCRKCSKQASADSKICRDCGAILEDIPDDFVPATGIEWEPASQAGSLSEAEFQEAAVATAQPIVGEAMVESEESAPLDAEASAWKCRQCGETVPGTFDMCWKCLTTKDGEKLDRGQAEFLQKIVEATESDGEAVCGETHLGKAKGECRHILGRCLGGILGWLIGVTSCGFAGYCICLPLRQPGDWAGVAGLLGLFAGAVIGSILGPIAGVLIGARVAEKADYRKSGEVPTKQGYRRFLGTCFGGVLGWVVAFVSGLFVLLIGYFLLAVVLWIIAAIGSVAGAVIGSLLAEKGAKEYVESL